MVDVQVPIWDKYISIRASRMRGDTKCMKGVPMAQISIRASRMRGDGKFDTSHLTM